MFTPVANKFLLKDYNNNKKSMINLEEVLKAINYL